MATEHPDLRELYKRCGCCMAYIAVEKDGIEAIGSAFHVGEGVFVTARHVVDGTRIKEMRLTNPDLYYRSDLFPKCEGGGYLITPDTPRICTRSDGLLKVTEGPCFHATEAVDIAILRVEGMQPAAHFIPLGGHLDDWVGRGDFELSETLVLGYPPIPFTRSPGGKWQMHFLLSGAPRGGFSGGAAFSRWGFALGVVTQSLLNQSGPSELGYFAATSIEVVWDCLIGSKMVPKSKRTDGTVDGVRYFEALEIVRSVFGWRPLPSTISIECPIDLSGSIVADDVRRVVKV